MNKSAIVGMFLLTSVFLPLQAFGNAIYNRAPGFKVPEGNIAFLGSYYSPMKIFKNGSTHETLTSVHRTLLGLAPDQAYSAGDQARAVSETNELVDNEAMALNLPLSDAPLNETYQTDLLKHIYRPDKFAYNPAITAFCGNQPYILIIVIDFYTEFACSVNIRESQDGKKIDYSGKRSILEQDLSMFSIKGHQTGVAQELFLVSTKDGSTVWQAHTISTTSNAYDPFHGLNKELLSKAFDNLLKP